MCCLSSREPWNYQNGSFKAFQGALKKNVLFPDLKSRTIRFSMPCHLCRGIVSMKMNFKNIPKWRREPWPQSPVLHQGRPGWGLPAPGAGCVSACLVSAATGNENLNKCIRQTKTTQIRRSLEVKQKWVITLVVMKIPSPHRTLAKKVACHSDKYALVHVFQNYRICWNFLSFVWGNLKRPIFSCNLWLLHSSPLNCALGTSLYGRPRKWRNLNVMWKANSNWARWHLCQKGALRGSPWKRPARTPICCSALRPSFLSL